MKQIVLIIILMMSSGAWGARSSTRYPSGTALLSGIVGVGSSTYCGTLYQFDLSYHHFVWDQVAIGGLVGTSGSSCKSLYEGGPSVVWYFFENSSGALHIGQAIIQNVFTAPKNLDFLESRTSLGYDYFFSKNVYLAPTLRYSVPLKTIADEYKPTQTAFEITLGVRM